MQVVLAHADPHTRDRLSAVLARVGHEVRPCAGADQALEWCRDSATDVAVVDVDLCRGDEGIELLRSIKGDAAAFGTAVVLLERADLDLGAAVEALHRGV